MRKICLLLIPAAIAVSCSVLAQPSTNSAAANNTQQVAVQQQPVQQIQQPAQQQVFAQPQQQQTVTVSGNSQVPVTTVVPVQQPVQQIDYSTVITPVQQQVQHQQQRAMKAGQFAARMDSLVRSGNFYFYPTTMQETHSGSEYRLIADFFYFAMSGSTAEVNLPAVNSTLGDIGMLNFDSAVSDTRLYPYQSGISLTFTLRDGSNSCFARFVVSTVTGETVLQIVTSDTSMRYSGWLSKEKLHED